MFKQYNLYYVSIIINIVESAISQNEHIHIQQYRPKCENGASLVENFFNIIFSEFQNFPPTCVCVQMCPEQPTYCYPNGCFKVSVNKRKTESPVSKIDGKAQSAMFLVDGDKDLFEILEKTNAKDMSVKTARPLNEFILRPNPFTELVLKQKRLPKLKMRYNLREQVKNTKPSKLKRDSVNLSKTRWPLNKQVFHSKQPRSEINHYKKNDDKKQTNFYTSMIREHEAINYTPKYLTKYLTKRENGNVNMEAIYLYKTDSANFSLEALIDNMIEGSLDENTNNFKLDLNINMNNSRDLSAEATRKVLRKSDFNMTSKTMELKVISLNSSNETSDSNKYIGELITERGSNINVTENIEEMSKKIDGQNKMSIEIVEKMTGSKHPFPSQVPQMPIEIPGEILPNIAVNKSSIPETNNIIVDRNNLKKRETLTITDTNVPLQSNIIKRKSKQRVMRTLSKRKFN